MKLVEIYPELQGRPDSKVSLDMDSRQPGLSSFDGTLPATRVKASELGEAAYDDVQDYMNFFGDRTLLTGGGITDNGNGTVTVAAGTAWCKVTDSETAVGKFFNFDANNSVSLTNMVTNHIYVDYNGGAPQIVVETSILTHGFKLDHIHLATVFRDGTVAHFHETNAIGIGRINRADMHHREESPVHRASGIVTSPVGTRNLSITTGVLYEGMSRHTTNAFNTSVAGTFSYWWTANSGSSWTEVTGATQISRTQYNDITSGLESLTSNRYGVHWVYMETDGEHFHTVYGRGDYKANEAEEATPPSILPDVVVNYCVLIAKIISREGTDDLIILYPWTTIFMSTLATDHGSLGGLTNDDHILYASRARALMFALSS